MARRAVTIEKKLCGILWGSVLSRAQRLDMVSKVAASRDGLVATASDAKQIASGAIHDYRDATLDLFGAEKYEPDEIAGLKYLKTFT